MKTSITYNKEGLIIMKHPEKNEIANLTLKRLQRYGFVGKLNKNTYEIGLSFNDIFDELELSAEDIAGAIIDSVENSTN